MGRRNCRRLGPRLLCRGADADGHVANFVETEQIVEVDDVAVSFVVVRGSVPLLWHQRQTVWKRVPPILLAEARGDNQASALERHVQRLSRDYAKCVAPSARLRRPSPQQKPASLSPCDDVHGDPLTRATHPLP